MLHNFYYI